MIDINAEYEGMEWADVVDDGTAWELANWAGEIPQVVLFQGPYGCGKNLLAYLFANEISNVEIHVRNTVDNTAKGAEELITQFSAPPFVPQMNQVCVLNEFTLFRKDAQGKFKDIFQAPPRRTYFFVCTNAPETIIPDIRNRFGLVVGVSRLDEKKAYELVERTCNKDSVNLSKTKKLAIAKGSGGVPRTIRNVIKVINENGDSSDTLIRQMLQQYSADDNHKSFMDLFFYLIKKRSLGNTSPQNVKALFEATGIEADAFRFKTLGMIYNSFLNVGMEVYLELLPSLEKGAEKHDLLVRLLRLLR